MKFNSKNIDSLPAPEKGFKLYRYENGNGLVIRVSKKSKAFQVVFKDGTRKTLKPLYSKDFGISDALAKANKMRDSKKDDTYNYEYADPKNTPTIKDLATEYIIWAKNKKKENSLTTDIERIKNHILPNIGHMPINKIRNRDIMYFLETLKGKQHTYTYIKNIDNINTLNITVDKIQYWLKQLNYNNVTVTDEEARHISRSNIAAYLKHLTQNPKLIDLYLEQTAQTFSVTKTTTQGTANKCKALLSHMFNSALTWNDKKWECLKANPCIGIKSTQSKAKTRYLNKNELDRLFEVLLSDEHKGTVASNLIRFLLYTGARASEAQTAKWEHFDLETNVWRKPNKESKTKLAPPVSLGNKVLNLLEEMRTDNSQGYLFAGKKTNTHIVSIRGSFEKIMKQANIYNCSLHDLRRTFGTQILLNGKRIEDVQALLGHNNISTTQKHYAFLNRETLHDTVNVLDDIMG